jgi:hypothetical protein
VPTQSWLDRFDFLAAGHASLFGSVAKRDLKPDLDRLSDSELHSVWETCFEVVNDGAESVSGFLLDLQQNYERADKL